MWFLAAITAHCDCMTIAIRRTSNSGEAGAHYFLILIILQPPWRFEPSTSFSMRQINNKIFEGNCWYLSTATVCYFLRPAFLSRWLLFTKSLRHGKMHTKISSVVVYFYDSPPFFCRRRRRFPTESKVSHKKLSSWRVDGPIDNGVWITNWKPNFANLALLP